MGHTKTQTLISPVGERYGSKLMLTLPVMVVDSSSGSIRW